MLSVIFHLEAYLNVVIASLKAVPCDPCLLCPCEIPSHVISGCSVWSIECGRILECGGHEGMWLLRLSHKRHCHFHFALSDDSLGRRQQPCCKDTQVVHRARKWDFLTGATLEEGPLALVKSSGDYSPGKHTDYILLRDHQPESLS